MTDNTVDMSDAELDAAIFNNPSEHDTDAGSESGQGDDTSVSPLDDTEGQPEAEVNEADVDQSEAEAEDPEGSLSTEENESGEGSKEPDVDDESTDDNSEERSEADLEADNEPIAFQPLRADGKEYPIESMQELYTLASKGINANRKWEESAQGRKIQQTMAKNNITPDDINTLIEMKGGDKNAILSLLKKLDIDPLDMDADAFNGEYKPKDYAPGDFEVKLDDVISRIKDQPRYQETADVIMNKWDTESREAFYEDPNLMELLNIDMQTDPETGVSMYDKVSPVAEKLKAMDSGSKTDLAYYMEAGKKVIGAINTEKEAKATAQKIAQDKKAAKNAEIAKKKKAAASSGGQTAGQKPVDVTELSDEELDALLA